MGDKEVETLSAGWLRPYGPKLAEAKIGAGTGTDDDADGGLLPAAAARRKAEFQLDDDDELDEVRKLGDVGIDKITSTKVAPGDLAAAEARNHAIDEQKLAGRDSGFIEPECFDPTDQPKPATGFVVAAKRTRVDLKDRQAGIRLIQIARQIEQTKDRRTKGRLLREAKVLVGHGKFETWVADKLTISPRTAREIMAEKEATFAHSS